MINPSHPALQRIDAGQTDAATFVKPTRKSVNEGKIPGQLTVSGRDCPCDPTPQRKMACGSRHPLPLP